MDNNSPSISPMTPTTPMTPTVPAAPAASSSSTTPITPATTTTAATNPAPATPAKDNSNLIKIIVIIGLSLIAATFIGLFIWMAISYNDAKTDLDGKISVAVASAVDEKSEELELEFAEREKDPYQDFSGPEDYGQLSFKYPKTWSVYIDSDASKGGNFEAYFNPGEVNPVSDTTINALRVVIRDKSFDDVAAEYEKEMKKKDSNLTIESIKVNNLAANRYTGTIPGTDLNGFIVIFKIRDKTAILRTDSVLFKDDFDRLLSTVVFNS